MKTNINTQGEVLKTFIPFQTGFFESGLSSNIEETEAITDNLYKRVCKKPKIDKGLQFSEIKIEKESNNSSQQDNSLSDCSSKILINNLSLEKKYKKVILHIYIYISLFY